MKSIKKTTLAISFLVLASCASNLKPVQFATDADPNAEINRLDQDMRSARSGQTDVAAPKSFKMAEKYLAKAQDERAEGKSTRDILEDVGLGRAALNRAQKAQDLSEKQYSDIMTARESAIVAGAASFQQRQLKSADEDFRNVTEDYEAQAIKQWEKGTTTLVFNDISQGKRESLKNEYADIELASLKSKHLGRAQGMIETAEKNSASSFAPKSLNLARIKYKDAETVIANNRQDLAAIESSAREANIEAEKLMRVTNTARAAKGLSSEEIALNIEGKKEALDEAKTTAVQRTQMIQQRNSELAGAMNENKEFRRQADFEATLVRAQKMFPSKEADVYRQGDKILIRLKSGNFVSGRSEVGAAAYPVLGKVKELLAEVKAEDVAIEGHTDITGSKEVNMKLSKERADAVKAYLTNNTELVSDQITTEGFGFDKPLAPNNTKTGRAQNRRVDIIVTPSSIR